MAILDQTGLIEQIKCIKAYVNQAVDAQLTNLSKNRVIKLLGYVPARKDGDTLTGNYVVLGDLTANRVYNAVYNDYAENFPKGEETEPGDLIVLDTISNKEQYIKSNPGNKKVVGVHSDEYAFLIGGAPENKDGFIPVSLAGRVHTKIIGRAKKNSYVVASDMPGIARIYNADTDDPLSVFGILVEEDDRDDVRKLKVKLK